MVGVGYENSWFILCAYMGIMSVQGMRVREMHAWIPSIEQLTLVTKRAYVLIKKKPIWMNEFMKAK